MTDVYKPYYQDDAVTLYCGDCREILPTLGRFDLLLTDPPYGIDYNPTRSQGSAASGSRKKLEKVINDDAAFDPSLLMPLGDAILWGANNYAARLNPSNGWLIWDKRDCGTLFKGFIASDAELAWTNITGRTHMFSHRWCGHLRDSERSDFFHPTQKPIALMRWCLSFAPDAATILDPFAVSGKTGVAAKLEGRKATLIEMEERYCEIAANRLSQGVLF